MAGCFASHSWAQFSSWVSLHQYTTKLGQIVDELSNSSVHKAQGRKPAGGDEDIQKKQTCVMAVPWNVARVVEENWVFIATRHFLLHSDARPQCWRLCLLPTLAKPCVSTARLGKFCCQVFRRSTAIFRSIRGNAPSSRLRSLRGPKWRGPGDERWWEHMENCAVKSYIRSNLSIYRMIYHYKLQLRQGWI